MSTFKLEIINSQCQKCFAVYMAYIDVVEKGVFLAQPIYCITKEYMIST